MIFAVGGSSKGDVVVHRNKFSVAGVLGLASGCPTAVMRAVTPGAAAISSIMPLWDTDTTPLSVKSKTMPK